MRNVVVELESIFASAAEQHFRMLSKITPAAPDFAERVVDRGILRLNPILLHESKVEWIKVR